jgi:hypothetical protein
MTQYKTTEFKDSDIPIHRVAKLEYPERLRLAELELVKLREFVQWVADHSNDPTVVQEARARARGAK